MAIKDTDKMNLLLGKTLGCALLDSGCSKTVCSAEWLNIYLETLRESDGRAVIFQPSRGAYRFWDGKRMTAIKCITFPCEIAGKSVKIKADVVECNIPLLFSRTTTKEARMVLDLNKDSVTVFNKTVALGTKSLGHYTLTIYNSCASVKIEAVLLSIDSIDKRAIALKLHTQFAHTT